MCQFNRKNLLNKSLKIGVSVKINYRNISVPVLIGSTFSVKVWKSGCQLNININYNCKHLQYSNAKRNWFYDDFGLDFTTINVTYLNCMHFTTINVTYLNCMYFNIVIGCNFITVFKVLKINDEFVFRFWSNVLHVGLTSLWCRCFALRYWLNMHAYE